MATARAKISIKVRVVQDAKTVSNWGKLYDESVKVQTVVDWSMEKTAAQTEHCIAFKRVEACLSEEALERSGTHVFRSFPQSGI